MTAPTVGRIVHYRAYGTPGGEYQPACRAAIVTEVVSYDPDGNEPAVLGLAVLNPTGLFFNESAEDARDNPSGGSWHWPCVMTEEK